MKYLSLERENTDFKCTTSAHEAEGVAFTEGNMEMDSIYI
jgi:hypothetical protein